jgi:hypothetical protein
MHRAFRVLANVSLSVFLFVSSSSALAGEKTGVGLNKISLPSGPGSIEGLGDSFEPQLRGRLKSK